MELITENTFEIKGIEPVILLGPYDANLKKIRQEFPDVQISARGAQITLQGKPETVTALRQLFRELIFLADKHGEVLDNDLNMLITLALSPSPQLKPLRQHDADVILTTADYTVRAKTDGQRRMVAEAKSTDIVFAIGPAGTGKTYTAVAIAVAALNAKTVKRIVLARPAVEAGENLGFLPGDLAQKIDPYLRPLYDALQDMLTAEKLKLLTEKRVIEIVPLAYMRGRTLSNAFIILDEAQNCTAEQMKMFLTRLGFDSKAVITGDMTQSDLPNAKPIGLLQAQDILKEIEGIKFIYFSGSDVVRHALVQRIIEAYEKTVR